MNLWLFIKFSLKKPFLPHHKVFGLWCSQAKALQRTVLLQSPINKDATKSSFYFYFFFPLCVFWMLLCSFVIRWGMAPAFSAFKSSPDTSWVGGFWPIWRHSSCCEKNIIIIWGCDLDTCLFQMGEMMEGRVQVEVSCGRNDTVLTAEKWWRELTLEGMRDCLEPTKWANIFTLVGKADFFSLSKKKQNR